jgi:Transglycosylase SLT domain
METSLDCRKESETPQMRQRVSSILLVAILLVGIAAPMSTAHTKQKGMCASVVAKTWPTSLQSQATRVCSCESSGNPSAASRISSAKGLFQFVKASWARWGRGQSVFNPIANSRAAYRYFKWARRYHPHGGWGPWECKP